MCHFKGWTFFGCSLSQVKLGVAAINSMTKEKKKEVEGKGEDEKETPKREETENKVTEKEEEDSQN